MIGTVNWWADKEFLRNKSHFVILIIVPERSIYTGYNKFKIYQCNHAANDRKKLVLFEKK